MITVIPLEGIPEIEEGDDLARLLADAAARMGGFETGDILVVAQKAVSKVEGRVVASPISSPPRRPASRQETATPAMSR